MLDPLASDPEALCIEAERDARVRDAVLRLPLRLRQVVVRRFWEGETWREIGDALGMWPGNVHMQGERALCALRDVPVFPGKDDLHAAEHDAKEPGAWYGCGKDFDRTDPAIGAKIEARRARTLARCRAQNAG